MYHPIGSRGCGKVGDFQRKRSGYDERVVMITITENGEKLHDEASGVPAKMAGCVTLESEEAMQLYTLLHKLMKTF